MAGKKPALGRGLDALFGDIEVKAPVKREGEQKPETIKDNEPDLAGQENAVLYIDIDDIKPNSMQPRQSFDPEAIDELAASIEAYGVLQPVILAKAEKGFELVAGERRWRAARKAGLKTVPAIIREVTNEENAIIALIENMQREDLNTIEEATAFRTIISKYKMTQEVLARAVGKSRPHITNTLRTLTMAPEIVEFLRSGALTLGHANALGAVKDVGKQVKLAEKAAKTGLSVRETEKLAAALSGKKPKQDSTQGGKTNEIRVVENELTSVTGIRVAIRGAGEKGRVELHYFDRQGLEEIIEFLRNAGKKRK